MTAPILLASRSPIRASLLQNAGIPFELSPVRIDEATIREALVAEGVAPDQIADSLADAKALKAATKAPDRMVLGCDQVLALGDDLLSKPQDPEEAVSQLLRMQGRTHQLLSAAVLYENAQPVWRYTGRVRLTMRAADDAEIRDYVARNWDSIKDAVGCYKLEEQGVRLFTRIDGDYFTVLGLPLLELIGYLFDRKLLKI